MTMNLYPVKAKVDGIVVRNLRLQANQAGTVVWQFDRDTGDVSEFVRIDAQPEREGMTRSFRVGDLVFDPQRGCGCNHPMYTWVPPEH